MKMQSIEEILKKFSQLKVLVIGDVMIDRYLRGRADRMSPEAAVPVVLQQEVEDRPGGAANVVLNIQALGARAFLCSSIGCGPAAEALLSMFPDYGLPTSHIIQVADRITTVKTRIIANGQQLLRLDHEQSDDLPVAAIKKMLDQVKELLNSEPMDAMLLQDYNKGVLSTFFIRELLELAQDRNIPVMVDPKYYQFFEYRQVALFKPNLREVSAALGRPVPADLSALKAAAMELRERLNYENCLITLSEQGVFVDDGSNCEIVPTQQRQIADVCGAGDTVISVATLGLLAGMDLRNLARLTNLAGGQVCEYAGVVQVNKQQLVQEWKAMGALY